MENADAVRFTIRREFKAPRELVFRTMMETAHLQHWWGPKECKLEVLRHVPRPGGMFHYAMHYPAAPGATMYGRFDYREIERPHRIVFVNGFADEEGRRIHFPGMPGWPLQMLITITLEEEGGRTVCTLHCDPLDAAPAEEALFKANHPSMQMGFGGMFDVYEGYLAKVGADDREIVIKRTLSAPRALVYQAFTDPRHIDQWWGPTGFVNTTTGGMDVRPGGVWRFKMAAPDGTIYPNRIDYQKVVPAECLEYDHGADTDAGPMFHVIVTFEDAPGGKTLLTMRSIFPTHEAMAMVIERVGAIEGGQQTVDKLEAYLRGLTPHGV